MDIVFIDMVSARKEPVLAHQEEQVLVLSQLALQHCGSRLNHITLMPSGILVFKVA